MVRRATETAFTNSVNGVEMTLTYVHKGDEVIKQTTSNVIDCEASGLANKEQAQELLDPMVAQADDVEEYDQSIEYGETRRLKKSRLTMKSLI